VTSERLRGLETAHLSVDRPARNRWSTRSTQPDSRPCAAISTSSGPGR